MPYAPKRGCRHPGCRNLVKSGVYCEIHTKTDPEARRAWEGADERRESAAKRGYDSKWRQAREGFLAAHPLCAECLKTGRHTAATVVDHIIPHRGDKKLFWDRNNWQPLCRHCHTVKTASGR